MSSVLDMRRRDGAEIEDLVGERLRSILAAARPRPGWVPGRVAESSTWVGERVAGEPGGAEVADAGGEAEQPDGAANAAEPVAARPRAVGSGARVRWHPGRPGAAAMCLVAVLAAVLSAGLTWWFRPEPSGVDGVDMQPSAGSAGLVADSTSDEPVADGATDSGPGTGTSQLVVSVIGLVHQPGLVTVEDGSRVADAINAAGGALPEADLSTVNLARLLVDGEQIAVGIAGSSLPGGDASEAQGLVNLNTASQAELEALPGIGPVLAQRIIDYRDDNGGFSAVEQLREISGIGPSLYEDIADLVTV